MLRFPARRFLEAFARIEQVRQELGRATPQTERQILGRAATLIQDLGLLADAIGMPRLGERGRKTMRDCNDGKLTIDRTLDRLETMRDDVLHGIGEQCYKAVPAEDRRFYETPLLDAATAGKFPAANEELQEAGKCFALDRHTASVYHAMRALEIGLRALADRFGVPHERRTWDGIIGNLETAIAAYRKANPTDPLVDSYLEATLHFRAVKDAWRNHVMHARQSYGRDKAEEIMEHTAGLIRDLAGTGLQERP